MSGALPTWDECAPWTDVRDAPWLWSYATGPAVAIHSARRAPEPTLARQFHSLRARGLLAAWLAKHPGRAVYGVAVEERWRPAVKWRKQT